MTSCLRIVPKFSIPISRAIVFNSVIDIAWSLAMLMVVPGSAGAGVRLAGADSSAGSTGLVGTSSSSDSVGGASATAVAMAPSLSSVLVDSSISALAFAVLGLVDFFVTLGIKSN